MDAGEREWLRAAAAVLRRSGQLAPDAADEAVWDALTRHTVEGIAIPPLGAPGPPVRGERPPGGPARRWDVRAWLCDPDPARAARSAVADLEGGATSLWVIVGGAGCPPADLDPVLAGVRLDAAAVTVSARGDIDDVAAATAFAAILGRVGTAAAAGTSLGADPFGALARTGAGDPGATVREAGLLAADLGVRAVVADGTVAHGAGAGEAAALGYVLACAAGSLRALAGVGFAVPRALALLECRLAVTDDVFVSIASLRAARLAWRRMAELCGVTGTDDVADAAGAEPRVHAVTSWAMLTRQDPWVNQIRGTVAGFAAAVGGADAITVLPFDAALGVPDETGRRLARNVSALLIGEAHAARVADPARGAWALDELTERIARSAWEEFGRIEESGGVDAALRDGSLRARWAATAAERAVRIADGRQPVTGVTVFPAEGETLPQRVRWPHPADHPRWAEDAEWERDARRPAGVR